MNINRVAASFSPAGRYLINILSMELILKSGITRNIGIQKRRGRKFLRAYPWSQAFALPLGKDKQRKACPRRVNIYIRTTTWTSLDFAIYAKAAHEWVHLINIYRNIRRRGYKKSPTQTLRCITAVPRFKFAKFDFHRQVTFENVL